MRSTYKNIRVASKTEIIHSLKVSMEQIKSYNSICVDFALRITS